MFFCRNWNLLHDTHCVIVYILGVSSDRPRIQTQTCRQGTIADGCLQITTFAKYDPWSNTRQFCT